MSKRTHICAVDTRPRFHNLTALDSAVRGTFGLFLLDAELIEPQEWGDVRGPGIFARMNPRAAQRLGYWMLPKINSTDLDVVLGTDGALYYYRESIFGNFYWAYLIDSYLCSCRAEQLARRVQLLQDKVYAPLERD